MKNKLELIILWRVFNYCCRRPAFFKKKNWYNVCWTFFFKA